MKGGGGKFGGVSLYVSFGFLDFLLYIEKARRPIDLDMYIVI
jgi:hypothetical protein